MRDRGRLNRGQFAALMLVSVFPTVVLLLPGDLLRLGGRSGWWTPLVLAPLLAAVAWGTGRLAGPGGDAARAALGSLGPVAGRVLLGLLWAGVGNYVTTIVPELAQLTAMSFVTGAVPYWVLVAVIVPACVLLASWGAVVLGRTAIVVVPALTVVVLGVVAVSLAGTHLSWALPLRPRTAHFARPAPLARTAAFLVEPIFLAPVLMGRADARTRRSAGPLLAALVVGVAAITALVTWVLIADGGLPQAAATSVPFFGLVDATGVGPSVQNLETIVLPILVMGTILKLAVFLWAWVRLGSALWRIPPAAGLPLHAALAVALGLVVFPTLLILDRWLGPEGDFVVPVLLTGMLACYARAGVAGRGRRA